mmetsp:Transcript_14275/g.24284  ORF Transcript_14275/g.24284 Transcript_14275/m.24284 type:complete len:113 (-) Transcript_14275:68-406(-)
MSMDSAVNKNELMQFKKPHELVKKFNQSLYLNMLADQDNKPEIFSEMDVEEDNLQSLTSWISTNISKNLESQIGSILNQVDTVKESEAALLQENNALKETNEIQRQMLAQAK